MCALPELLRHGEGSWRHRCPRTAARHVAVERYDLHSSCLPRQIAWVGQLAAGRQGV